MNIHLSKIELIKTYVVMRIAVRSILMLCVITTLFTACTVSEEVKVDEKELARQDSLALHVALFPCEGTLPLYYASAKNMFEQNGLDVRLLYLNTMEECDTALIHHRVELTMSDLARLLCMRREGINAIAVAQMPGSLQLYTAKGKRLTTVKQLKERILAIDRHSESDYYSDAMLEGTGLEHLDIFRTQFNNHKLRCDMLNNQLVDAALLDEPYASFAEQKGAQRIFVADSTQQRWTVWATTTNFLNDEYRWSQICQLINVYQKAVDELKHKPATDSIKIIFKQFYELPHSEVDTLPLLTQLHYAPLQAVRSETVERVKVWLVNRKQIKSTISTDSVATSKAFKP